MERVIQLPSSLLSLPSLSPAQCAQTHPVAGAFHVLPGGWSGFLQSSPAGPAAPCRTRGGSESTAAAVPCSAPDLQPPAAKGTAGGTGVWAEFQAIAPLGTCCFFFFFFSRPAWHARANDGRKTQQGRTKHKGSDRPSRDRQGQRVTPGLTQGGLTPSRGFSTCRELHGYKQLGFLLEGSWESPPGMLGARRGEVGAPWGAAKPGACNKSSSCQKIPTENNHLRVD